MAVEAEQNDAFAQYAHPERLVSTQWVADHVGTPGVVVVESDEDVLLYETGHIPGSASRLSTCAPPASTPVSCCTCRTTPRKGPCVAATSRVR